MRDRVRRRIWRQVRRLGVKEPAFARAVERGWPGGVPVEERLEQLAHSSLHSWHANEILIKLRHRPYISRLLSELKSAEPARVDEIAGYLCGYRRPHPRALLNFLLEMADAPDESRQEIAVYGIKNFRQRIAREKLIEIAGDVRRTEYIRGRAIDGLTCNRRKPVPPLVFETLHDPSPLLRFWSVFALCSSDKKEYVAMLLPLLNDHAEAPGWWSVAREVQGMLPSLTGEYEQLWAECEKVLANPDASKSDVRWARSNQKKPALARGQGCQVNLRTGEISIVEAPLIL